MAIGLRALISPDRALSAAEHAQLVKELRAQILRDASECLQLRPPYSPSIFIGKMKDYGPIEACRHVIMDCPPSTAPYGFGRLWDAKRLDLTTESLVLKPKWHPLFDERVRERAAARLAHFKR